MGPQFYATLFVNVALLLCLVRWRPPGMGCILAGVCAFLFDAMVLWPLRVILLAQARRNGLSWSPTFDHIWGYFNLYEIAIECIMLLNVMRLTKWMKEARFLDWATFVAFAFELDAELHSYWIWNPFNYKDGLELLHLSQWIYVVVVVLLCRIAYVQRAHPALERR